ncbi:MAG: carboxypeptidase-like regulatory domain-containing protein, partial [Bacteroidota bacterium]|nr:carboxypeptidase-like regulatory domain-containing protein [Bacteroidota bacterium]
MRINSCLKTIHSIRTFPLKSVRIHILLLFLFFTTFLAAQETLVVGQVVNSSDKTPIPGVNISFKNSQVTAQTNEEGYFVIRTTGRQNTLVFSCVGYKKLEIKVKPGEGAGVQIEMNEEDTLLREAFIIPGVNPAIDLMRKVRLAKKRNDVSRQKGFNAQSTEQILVLLSKINQRSLSKRIFDQLKKGDLSHTDSALVLPLYMTENKYRLTESEKKLLSKNVFSSP